MYHTFYGVLVLLKLFIGTGCAGCFTIALPSVSQSRNLEFVNGASDRSATISEGRRGIFNVH